MSAPSPTLTRSALKEWAAAIAALLDGRQTVLLRKGGIHEKRFAVPDPDQADALFPLFPTTAHSHVERVRPEFRDLVAATAADSTTEQIVVRAVARVVDSVEVHQPDRIADLERFHLWTTESIRADRLDFRPRHRLAALIVQVHPIEPVVLPRLPEYAGCKSWIDLTLPVAPIGPGAHPEAELQEIAAEVRRAVGP